MSKIDKKLVHFNNKTDFITNNDAGNILDTSIVFIKDSKEIWTHGDLYKSVNWSVLKLAVAGDIAYWDGSKIKTVSQENWDSSLGTAVGVVVVPAGFAPDGKARMLSLNWASSSSTSATSASEMQWGDHSTDTSLTNYTHVPTTDNAGSTTTGASLAGYLPSDKFTGTVSYVDPLTRYSGTSRTMIPSPYLGDEPNPAYYAEISGYNNALSDFDGKGNTDVLVALGADYVAANAARNYKAAGAEEIEWYLPAEGELGYMMVRFNKIQDALTKVSAPQLDGSKTYWSSSESEMMGLVWCVSMYDGNIGNFSDFKDNYHYVRPFALIP